jgi:transcriptional regulator GlxA family with amidase domain
VYNPRTVGIFVFDDVEILDFAGPYEVFNVAASSVTPPPFTVFTLGLSERPILARGRLQVTPQYSVDTCPQPDVLVIPGGFGTRALLKNERVIAWTQEQANKVELLLSVCTGALVLAQAGLLAGRPATTHHTAFDHLENLSPTTAIQRDARWVHAGGKIFTSGGISAGIDLSLEIVARLCGEELAAEVVDEMEYRARRS